MRTEQFFEQLKRMGHAVRFAPERKKTVRDYLVRMTAADVVLRTPRPIQRTRGWFFARPSAVLAGITGLVLVGGGTSFASQSALPGDVLYPVKVGITEKLVEVVQFTPDAQAEYAAELASRRLDEAAKLVEHGGIAGIVEEELAERFAEHASRASEALAVVRSRDAERAARFAETFEESIRVRGRVLGNGDDDDDEQGEIPTLAAAGVPADAAALKTAAPAPALMAVSVEPTTTKSSVEGAPEAVPAADAGMRVPGKEMEAQGGSGAEAESRKLLKMKIRNSLRELREFRRQAELEAREHREGSREDRSDDASSTDTSARDAESGASGSGDELEDVREEGVEDGRGSGAERERQND